MARVPSVWRKGGLTQVPSVWRKGGITQVPSVWRHGGLAHAMLMVLFALCWTPKTHAGPGPSPINSGSGKWWPQLEGEEDTILAAEEVNITTAEGHTASLPCRVFHLHDKTVSWIRAVDLTVLAVDRITVTTDARFSVKHPEETGDWILEIRGAAIKDSGTYDCQVNTYPKKSTRVNLRVLSQKDDDVFLEIPASDSIAPHTPQEVLPTTYALSGTDSDRPSDDVVSQQHAITLEIHGRSWAEVKAGKALGLSCEAAGESLLEAYASSRTPDSPLIEWTLDEVPVKLLFENEKVEVYEDWQTESVLSQLTLFDLRVEDSGTFACHAPHAVPQSIPVTVLHPGHRSSDANYEMMKHSRKGFERSKMSYSESRRFHQMDAAAATDGAVSSAPRHYGDLPRASSCSGHKTILISGAVMLAIMILNSVACLAMYCKTH